MNNKLFSFQKSSEDASKNFEPYFIHEVITPETLNNKTDFPLPEAAKPKDIRCKKCRTIVTDTYEFNKHAKSKHNLVHLCKICSMVFDTKQDKINHLDDKHTREYSCMFCHKKFWQQKELNIHIRNMHYDVKTETLRCDVGFESLKKLNSSSLQLKEEFFIHDVIKEEIKTEKKEETEKDEEREKAEEKAATTSPLTITRLKCKLCDIEYEDNESFNKHAKKSHSYKILCRFCSQVFFDKGTLDFHYMIKHDKNVFCRECGKKFWLKKCLDEHFNSVHGEGSEKRNHKKKTAKYTRF